MYTDMVGYTALGQRNESISLALVSEQRKLIRPILNRHNGKEVKTIGDAFLVEFSSALDAVRCAYDIQRAARELNISLPEDRRVHLRIGVHLGDVVESQRDISGDAVNIASRIESFSEDGGVCLTRQVYDHVQNKFDLPLTSLGSKSLKNVNSPIEVYKVVMPWEASKQIPAEQLDRRRIAILPFANVSPDPADEYFADGLTEELIDRLSQVRELEVIARTSVMSYKKKEKRAAEIARELNVGSIVEGSVRKAGNKIRVTAQLINGATEGHLWSSRYDKGLDDIFAVQGDIAAQVTDALKIQLLPHEKEAIEKRTTENTEAHTLYLKGRHHWNQRSPVSLRQAKEYFEKAVEIDPEFSLAYVGLADSYLVSVDQGLLEPSEANPRIGSLLSTALELSPTLAEAHASRAILLQSEWHWYDAEIEYKRAIELNPNYATTHHWYSILLGILGRIEEALDQIYIALRLDPLSPMVNTNVGIRLAEAGRFEEAIEQFRKALALEPGFGVARGHLGATYIGKSDYDEGIAEFKKAMELLGGNPWPKAMLAYAYALKGDLTNAQNLLGELEEASMTGFVPDALFATIYFGLGDKDKAFSLFRKAYDERSNVLQYIIQFPMYRKIRADPRFGAVLAKIVPTRQDLA